MKGKVKGKGKKFLAVYTVSFTEDVPEFGIEHHVAGSYLSRGDAIRACADLILEKIENRNDVRHMFLQFSQEDVSAVLARFDIRRVERLFSDRASYMTIPKDMRKSIRRFLIDVLGDGSCYRMKSEFSGFRFSFDIDENDVESRDGLPLWVCVTSGKDEERHDPEFEDATPEVFLTNEQAVASVIDDLNGWLEGYSKKEVRDIQNEAVESLKKRGHYEFRANDSVTRIWDVWQVSVDIGMGGVKNRKGAGDGRDEGRV